jgi:hypothetical protein
MNTFTAKYNGKCAISGQPIVAGQTEIAMIIKDVVLAQYAGDNAIEIANGLYDQLAAMMAADGQQERAERVLAEKSKNEGPFRFHGVVAKIRDLKRRIEAFND